MSRVSMEEWELSADDWREIEANRAKGLGRARRPLRGIPDVSELHCGDLAMSEIVLTPDQAEAIERIMADPNAGPKFPACRLPTREDVESCSNLEGSK